MYDKVFPLYADEIREVFLTEIADEAAAQGHPYDLGDDHGYFICELDLTSPVPEIEILGKASSYDAAIRLRELYVAASNKRSQAPIGR